MISRCSVQMICTYLGSDRGFLLGGEKFWQTFTVAATGQPSPPWTFDFRQLGSHRGLVVGPSWAITPRTHRGNECLWYMGGSIVMGVPKMVLVYEGKYH